MSKKHNLFISFAAEDNAKGSGTAGWVDDFIRFLGVYIQRINNEKAEFTLLEGNAKRPSALGEDEGIILIVSENYLKSNISKQDAPLMADPSRVFKIDLSPIGKRDQPAEIRLLNEFHFFAVTRGKKEKYVTLKGTDDSQIFWLKIIDLAFEINRTVFHKGSSAANENRKVIYLAETSYDQVHNRDEIKRELIRHGHEVLPKVPFTGNIKEIESQVNDCLEKADLSVHIVGEAFGEVPEGSDRSLVQIQNQLSTEYYSRTKSSEFTSLHRLIWMPLHLRPKSDEQKIYLDQLKDDIVSTSGAEIIQTPLEILKTIIHTRLQLFDQEVKAQKLKTAERSTKKTVYLLFDKKDEGDMSPIVSDLNAKGIEVILPKFDGKQIEFLTSHRESLVKSDGVLLFANKNLNWVNSKLNDVIKAPGFGKQFPFDVKAIFIKDKSIPEDKIPSFGDILMLNGNGKQTDITPFLDKIASA